MASRKRNENGLTAQQQKFADAYLEDPKRNATQAAIAAGYSPKTAYSIANENLNRPEVADYIARIDSQVTIKILQRFGVNQDRILQELACIAFLDILDLFGDDGYLKPIGEIPEHARRVIVGLEIEQLFEGQGKEKIGIGTLKKIKMGDKIRALELLGRNLKMWTDKIEATHFVRVNYDIETGREPPGQ